MPMTDERRAELRALCDAATRGPWEWVDGYLVGADGEHLYGPRNDAIIAASRTALPEALDEVDRLQSLAADGEKYRRLCELMERYHAELFWRPNEWRAFVPGCTSPVRTPDGPLEALEIAVKKAKETTDDA